MSIFFNQKYSLSVATYIQYELSTSFVQKKTPQSRGEGGAYEFYM